VSKVYFSSWQDEFIDNRGKSDSEVLDSKFDLPVNYNADNASKAFIGWNGIVLFDKDIDVIKLALMYAYQYQQYSEACGRCAPGRWGGRILYDMLDKIARGEGHRDDLEHLREISQTMALTSKCEIGKTVPTPILHILDNFEDEVLDLIDNGKKSKDYDNNSVEYKAKVTAPCIDACPAHVDIPAYIEGVRDLRFDDSLSATRQTMPLAHTCGRVCPHPCEDECRRANVDESISIMELKRSGADWETDYDYPWCHPTEPTQKVSDKKVAIVGAGPAGLTAAYYLAVDNGIKSDVYEELPVLGGEVAVGVPEFRMPWDKYKKDIELVESVGVNFITNSRVDAIKLKELHNDYDAVLLAFGTRLSKKIRCENERAELNGYWGAIDFLDEINLYTKWGIGSAVDLRGKSIVCVGGGFTSLDVVRCAVRAGAKRVVMIYRRDEKAIIGNTSAEEYHEAIEEGVEFHFQTGIDRIVDTNDTITSVNVNKFELKPDPESGRDKLVLAEGEEYVIECDYVIPAVSQSADLQLIPEEWNIELTSWGTLKTDGAHYTTNKNGLFAAGDCEYGPMTIVNAVGQAKRAASVMGRYLNSGEISLSDDEIMEDHLRKLKVYDKNEKVTGWVAGISRKVSQKLDVDIRKTNNKEVNLGFTRDEAIEEAQRCMRCYYISMVAV
jgi:formate dehydrogenase beta subunit